MSDQPQPRRLSLGQCASLACIWEATAAKPGNVHRGADFEDLTYLDLLTSAVAIGPIVGQVMRETKGRADGTEVARLIHEQLGV